VIPTSNQDGRQAKNRKKGEMKLKKISIKMTILFTVYLEFAVGFFSE
jgi:hypothetical protein